MTRRFAPSWVMTVCVTLSIAVLLGLGSWQLQRLFWKEALITRFSENIARPPVPWKEFVAERANDPEDLLEFTRVEVRGHYLHDDEMYLTSRSRSGAPGLSVLTPFQLRTGEILMVNRGWIDSDYRAPLSRADGLFVGDVTLIGLFRMARPVSGIRAAVLPDNDLVKNTWYTLDLPMMAHHTGLPLVQEYYLSDAREGEPKPYGRQWNFRLHNNHLQYAITWYALALALLVMFVLFGMNRAREESP